MFILVARKRPPTPPRKPKFNKLQGSSGDIFGALSSSSQSSSISKSESLKSISRIQRKFNGPLQLINDGQTNGNKTQESESEVLDSNTTTSTNKVAYMRTFSHEPTTSTTNNTSTKEVVELENDETDENVDSELYKDYDNIYDTVTPDSDCGSDLNEDQTQSVKDEDIETSSHEMLSRSSSTDEGLSNYVNIDYFLRKNSIGRSNSNIPGRSKKKNSDDCDDTEHEDNETNLSSMKSSDYDNFSSNENLINSIPPQTTSLKSFNSISTNSSTSGSSLRTRSLKLLNNNDLSASYPPNMSTFTPPIRDRNQAFFFKDNPLTEQEETSSSPLPFGNGVELSPIVKNNNSLDKSKEEYYAYTDILDSCKCLLVLSWICCN